MQYRKMKKIDLDLSVLGFGCMRLPTSEDGSIDEPLAKAMVRHAIDLVEVHPPSVRSVDLSGVTIRASEDSGPRPPASSSTNFPLFCPDIDVQRYIRAPYKK